MLPHKLTVVSLVRNEEERARGQNPLERGMSIKENGYGSPVIFTTNEKLARRIDRAINKQSMAISCTAGPMKTTLPGRIGWGKVIRRDESFMKGEENRGIQITLTLPAVAHNGIFSSSGYGEPSFLRDVRYSFHSVGRRYFFLLLHSLHVGTMFPCTDLPPRTMGMRWSIVRSEGLNFPLQ